MDEVEEVGKLGSRRREDQALQALRDFVDNAGSEVGFDHFCLYLAATPEMFDNQAYFPRYDALSTRIQAVGTETNWRAPVINLDRTPLLPSELDEMAIRIRTIHRAAYGNSPTQSLTDEVLAAFVSEISRSRFRIAKPRLLVRFLVDQMELARQDQPMLQVKDLGQAIQTTAERVLKEANA
ncbi:MAG TPA: BREX system ATP-binding domain-containing protein [Acidobacteriaceae bacterium]|jgi:hypothetical protein|nr:BREX system ATP-binding domain-containing protein [Acidobacteriaceae bacterium]